MWFIAVLLWFIAVFLWFIAVLLWFIEVLLWFVRLLLYDHDYYLESQASILDARGQLGFFI